MKEPSDSSGLLLLVDGHSFAYRSFHAIRKLTSPAGEPTNGIYGFVKSVSRMQNELRASHMAVIWDGGLAAERLALLPEYKAQRPPMPAGLEMQLNGMGAWLQASGIDSCRQDGVEADDWIATLACQAAGAGVRTVIASSDKDFFQLVSPRIGILNPNDKPPKIWTDDDVRAKTGVAPEQVVDWLSLVGDAVDNIAGIAGVGPKTAANLLQRFGSCANLLARVAEVEPERLRSAIMDGEEVVFRNRRMIQLNTSLAIPFVPDDLKLRVRDLGRLRSLYRGWGFNSLLAELDARSDQQETLGLWSA